MHWTIFVDSDIFHRMAPMQQLFSVTLTYFLKVNFLTLISRKLLELANKFRRQFL